MNIIIATSNVEFAKKLREGFKSKDVNVVDIVTCLEDFLGVLAENPDIDGVLLKTDLSMKGKDPRLEMLSDSILSIRKTPEFEKIVFSILTDYPEGHPLLAEFFAMGIYNFFSRGTAFNIDNLVKSFENPMSFSIAVKYRDPNPEFLWRKINTSPQVFQVQFDNRKQEETSISTPSIKAIEVEDQDNEVSEEVEELKEVNKKEKKSILPQINITFPKVEKIQEIELDEEWFINQQEDTESHVPSSVIGYILISVAAVKEHMGATNTAINIAKYLKQSGYDVALVEANKSLDFDRIHSLIEGEVLLIDDMEFTFQGIDHFKYREGFDIGAIYQRYQYIVLDIGVIEDSPYKNDFSRSHIKIVNASSDEWKHYWIEEFLLKYNFDDLVFVLPCADQNATRDVAERLKYYDVDVYALEKNSSPYIVSKESGEVYEQILLGHQAFAEKRTKSIKKQVASTVVLTALVMMMIFILILYFFTDSFSISSFIKIGAYIDTYVDR